MLVHVTVQENCSSFMVPSSCISCTEYFCVDFLHWNLFGTRLEYSVLKNENCTFKLELPNLCEL